MGNRISGIMSRCLYCARIRRFWCVGTVGKLFGLDFGFDGRGGSCFKLAFRWERRAQVLDSREQG